jgi:Ca2+-transporting ATPase
LAVAAKGAPEAIINLCHLQPDEEEKIQKQMKMMATKGYRILGVARGSYKSKI